MKVTKKAVLEFLQKQNGPVRVGYIALNTKGFDEYETGEEDENYVKVAYVHDDDKDKDVLRTLYALEKEGKVVRHYYSDKFFNWRVAPQLECKGPGHYEFKINGSSYSLIHYKDCGDFWDVEYLKDGNPLVSIFSGNTKAECVDLIKRWDLSHLNPSDISYLRENGANV